VRLKQENKSPRQCRDLREKHEFPHPSPLPHRKEKEVVKYKCSFIVLRTQYCNFAKIIYGGKISSIFIYFYKLVTIVQVFPIKIIIFRVFILTKEKGGPH
jgi:hypothetical protein